MRTEQINSLIRFNPAMFSVFLNSITRKKKSFLSSNEAKKKNSENKNNAAEAVLA